MFGTDVRNRQCSEQCSEPTKPYKDQDHPQMVAPPPSLALGWLLGVLEVLELLLEVLELVLEVLEVLEVLIKKPV